MKVSMLGSGLLAAGIVALGLAAPPAFAEGTATPTHKAFVLIEYQVRDQPMFKELREKVRGTLGAFKGDLVIREKVQPIFGSSPTNLSVISFPSVDDARSWLASKELGALRSEGAKAATVSTYLVEKLD